jgi:hypothetical protein
VKKRMITWLDGVTIQITRLHVVTIKIVLITRDI